MQDPEAPAPAEEVAEILRGRGSEEPKREVGPKRSEIEALTAANQALNEACEELLGEDKSWSTTLEDERSFNVSRREVDERREFTARAGFDILLTDKEGNRVFLNTNYVSPSMLGREAVVFGHVSITGQKKEPDRTQVIEALKKLGIPDKPVTLVFLEEEGPCYLVVNDIDWLTDLLPPKEAKPPEAVPAEAAPEAEAAVPAGKEPPHLKALRKKFEKERDKATKGKRHGWRHFFAKGKRYAVNMCLEEAGFSKEQIDRMSRPKRYAAAGRYVLGKTDEELQAIGLPIEDIPEPARRPPEPAKERPAEEGKLAPLEERLDLEKLSPEQVELARVIDEKITRQNKIVAKDKWPSRRPTKEVKSLLVEVGEYDKDEVDRWGGAKCWKEAAKVLGREYKTLPGFRKEVDELKAQVAKLTKRLAQLEQRVSGLEAENRDLKETLEKSKADKAILLAALINPESLSEEQRTRLEEMRAEAGVAPPETPLKPEEAPPSTAARPSGEEALAEREEREEAPPEEERPPVEEPTRTAVDDALDELVGRYVTQREISQRGWGRGVFFLPIVGAVGGGRIAQLAYGALEGFKLTPVPGVAALFTGIGSLIGSIIRRRLGEDAFSLWVRYSHTEGRPDVEGRQRRFGRVMKIGQMFTRGTERAVLRRILGLTGSDEVNHLLSFYDEQGNLVIPEELGSQRYIEGLIREGMWYALGVEVAEQLGAYYTPEEEAAINVNRPRVIQAVRQLIETRISEAQRENLLERVQEELIRRERGVWTMEAAGIAGIGIFKAAALGGVGVWVAEHIAPRVSELIHPPPTEAVPPGKVPAEVTKAVQERAGFWQARPQLGEVPLKIPKEEVATRMEFWTHKPQLGAVSPPEAPPEAPPVEAIPSPEEVKELTVQRTVGHTLVDNGINPDWGNLGIWQQRLLANDVENPTLWKKAAKMAEAIAGNPSKHLAGLPEGTRKTALAAAKRTLAALAKAGYNEKSHVLENSQAVLGDLQAIKDLFHWVYNGQKYLEPVVK